MNTVQQRDRHDARLRRGRRLWDLLSHTPYSIGERPSDPVRKLAIQNLHLRGGEAVLDIGCGAGAFFPALQRAVGPQGRVVGVDYSPKMLQRAQQRIHQHAWRNVEVRRADVTRTGLGREEFDAAVAVASLSAMPDVRAAVENAYNALRPGGRLFVFDMRLIPSGRPRIVTLLLRLAYRSLAGFTGEDVLAELRRTFDAVEVLPSSNDTITIVMAKKASNPLGRSSAGVSSATASARET